MSGGQKPRNPRYFPKMKVRGTRRRHLAPWQRLQRGFDMLGRVADEASKSLNTLGEKLH